jgi:23S rRNA G2445 N2-methylase RlmL
MKRIPASVARLIILSLALQGFGCAWMARSETDKIHVQSVDPQARLSVNGQFIGKGSGAATITREHPSTIWAEKNLCATTIQDTGSEFNPRSVRDYTNGAPLLSSLADALGVTQDVGKTAPLTYTVNPTCLPAKAHATS